MKLGGLKLYFGLGCEDKWGGCGFYIIKFLHVVAVDVDRMAAAVYEIMAEDAVKMSMRMNRSCLYDEGRDDFMKFWCWLI